MSDRIVSAIFDSTAEAQRALSELRSSGVPDSAISVIGRSDSGDGYDRGEDLDRDGDDDVNKSGALKGALGGAAAGTVLGIAALAIPGVGPLAAAGAIAAAAVPEAAAIGAAVGAAAGGVSGLLTKEGVSEEDSRYYEERLGQGGTVIAVHAGDGVSLEEAREVLYRHGGHSASRARTAAM